MKEVDIIVTNRYCPFITETFRTRVDMSDLNEVEMAADECCGEYLDMHHDYYQAALADLADLGIADGGDISLLIIHRDSSFINVSMMVSQSPTMP